MEDTIAAHEPKAFFDALGCLHDALVTSVRWDKQNQTISIGVDDLNSNFFDLPEYEGSKPVEIVFTEAQSLDCDIQAMASNLRIYDILIDKQMQKSVRIECSPVGHFQFQFTGIIVQDV